MKYTPAYQATRREQLARRAKQAAWMKTAAQAWACLTSSPRFQEMTVKEAVAEMRINGAAPSQSIEETS